jgi:Lrp/AsnC family transcriptional regulator, leucine-responsive regulatory protein
MKRDSGPQPDDIDLALVQRLVVDGRARLADLGKAVGLSAPAVKRRMDRLEAEGVITGYTAIVDNRRLGRPLEAFAQLTFLGTTKVSDIARIARDIPEVEAVYTTAGDPDALVHLRVRDVDHLRSAIDFLRRSGKVTGTKTLMVLDTWTRRART